MSGSWRSIGLTTAPAADQALACTTLGPRVPISTPILIGKPQPVRTGIGLQLTTVASDYALLRQLLAVD